MPSSQLGRGHAAEQRHGVGPDHQQRHRDRQRQHLRHDQPEAVRDAHHQHRVEFFGHPHHAELRGDGRAGAAGDQDRRQQRPEFADDAHAEDVDEVDVAAEAAQLLRRQVGQHHADQEADQRGDAQRLEAGVVDVGRNFAPRAAVRRRDEAAQVQHQLADQPDKAVQVLEKAQQAGAEHDDPVQRADLGARQGMAAGLLRRGRTVLPGAGRAAGCAGRCLPQAFQNIWAPMWSMLSTPDRSQARRPSSSGRVRVRLIVLSMPLLAQRMHLPDPAGHDRLRRAAGGVFDG